MSFIVGKGKEGKQAVETNFSKQLLKMKSGDSVYVRMVSAEDYVTYHAHSVHKTFYTTPCTKVTGTPDLYDKAADLLFQDARDAEKAGASAEKVKELKSHAAQLLPKARYLVAFISLETGEQILVDMTGNQGKAVTDSMEKYAKQSAVRAFELAKTGENTNSTFTFSPVLDMEEDISDKHQKMFEKTKDAVIDEEAFGKAFSVRDEAGQIDDLQKFGFDVSRLGIDVSAAESSDAGSEEVTEAPNPEDDF